jgi:hypothetical protein
VAAILKSNMATIELLREDLYQYRHFYKCLGQKLGLGLGLRLGKQTQLQWIQVRKKDSQAGHMMMV